MPLIIGVTLAARHISFARAACRHPLSVLPLIARRGRYYRGTAASELGSACIRVCLVAKHTVRSEYRVFIHHSALGTLVVVFPNAALAAMRGTGLPIAPFADDGYRARGRGIDTEDISARFCVHAEIFMCIKACSCIKAVKIKSHIAVPE